MKPDPPKLVDLDFNPFDGSRLKKHTRLRPEIVIIGFPKCGTTGLIRALEDDPRTKALRAPNGHLEVAWPMIKSMEDDIAAELVRVHKFAAYAYSREALEYLTESNPDSKIVLCIRSPKRALISWHTMHQSIARSGRNPKHFAYREREFYANCSLLEYYEKFAKDRLNYDQYLRDILGVVPKSRLIVLSQSKIAEDTNAISNYLIELAQGKWVWRFRKRPREAIPHVAYADTQTGNLARDIDDRLGVIEARLMRLIRKSRVKSIMLAPLDCFAYCAPKHPTHFPRRGDPVSR